MPFLNDEQFFNKYGLSTELLLEFTAPGDFLCYYTGSINEGRGSATSDVDIVMLANDTEIQRRASVKRYRIANGGRTAFLLNELRGAPVEVAVFLEEDMLEILDRLNSYDFRDPATFVNTRPLSSHLGAESVLSILHRLSIGKPLNQPERLRELQGRNSHARLCLWQARTRIARLNHLYEDLSGRLEIGEPESAFFLAREAVMSLGAIYTNFLGASIDRVKWWKVAFDSVSHRLPSMRDRVEGALYRDCSSKASRVAFLQECLDMIDEFHAQESALENALMEGSA